MALQGKNIFLTGGAGVGKSFLLKHIIAGLKARHGDQVAVTATTGIAASHISGVTLHSWAGIRVTPGKDQLKSIEMIIKNLAAPKSIQRLRNTKVLIVDEISMVDSLIFMTLGRFARFTLDKGKAFGGIQLVVSGDFHQLPPVSLRQTGFAFSTDTWQHHGFFFEELTTIVRQKGDLRFQLALRELREGICSKRTEELLATCHVSRKKPSFDGIIPTKLYCTNKNVDSENERQLEELPGIAHIFHSQDSLNRPRSDKALMNLQRLMDKRVSRALELKRGAQVMLLKNTPKWGLVNGSRGVVIRFDANKSNMPIVLFSNGDIHTIEPFDVSQEDSAGRRMYRRQLPIKLAWCLT
eukprot:CAMPEP_0116147400 /NCGR_PEP_ID=MMETSP0329-20121206/17734_1 /TAXON_ID=697910 /ORGANISM="Pseudo-nitzschia arenysensis, Strain B593" /LENGTH=352 /DNA_ID=CAMNT_0003643325 /DNA_START=196 /DNA_END=1250 /DNA_ORIENTATION=+